MQQRYGNLNGPVSIVILAAEFAHCGTNGGRDKIFWCCLTPQSPWLQHLWLANGLSGWRQGGVGLRDDENNGLSAWVSTISLLHSPCYSALFFFFSLFFFPSNKSGQPMAALCCRGRIYTLMLTHTHTHSDTDTHTQREKEVSGGWVDCGTEKKQCKHYCLCRCEMATLLHFTFEPPVKFAPKSGVVWFQLFFFYYHHYINWNLWQFTFKIYKLTCQVCVSCIQVTFKELSDASAFSCPIILIIHFVAPALWLHTPPLCVCTLFLTWRDPCDWQKRQCCRFYRLCTWEMGILSRFSDISFNSFSLLHFSLHLSPAPSFPF